MTKLIFTLLIIVIICSLILSLFLLSQNTSKMSENTSTHVKMLEYSSIVNKSNYKNENPQEKINQSYNVSVKDNKNITMTKNNIYPMVSNQIKFYSLSGNTNKTKRSTVNYLCITPSSISEIYSVDLEDKFKNYNYFYYVVDKNKKEYFIVTSKQLPSHVEMICGKVDYFDNTTVIIGELFV